MASKNENLNEGSASEASKNLTYKQRATGLMLPIQERSLTFVRSRLISLVDHKAEQIVGQTQNDH